MQRGQQVYLRDGRNPLNRLTLLFDEERFSRTEPDRKIIVVYVFEWRRRLSLWKEDVDVD